MASTILNSAVLLLCLASPIAEASGMLRAGGVIYPADLTGFWGRLLAGNIDAVGSEAYNRWGAGYDKGIADSDRRLAKLAHQKKSSD